MLANTNSFPAPLGSGTELFSPTSCVFDRDQKTALFPVLLGQPFVDRFTDSYGLC